jgi:moderate conductance mechanosensitive channel
MIISSGEKLRALLQAWGDGSLIFLQHDMPKVVLVIIVAFVLIRLLRLIAGKITTRQTRKLPSGIRMQQVRTVASVITSIGVFVIVFVAALEILPLLGFNLGPVLASAGIVGLAIGFGAQTLAHDFINGFFILLDNQYDIGDEVKIAGVHGIVEEMTLRRTTLRDDDGTVHIVPNSEATVVSNMTRDWSQLTMRIVVAYNENSDRIVKLLQQLGEEMRQDPRFEKVIVSDVQVPGIDRVGNGEAEYLMLVKTLPNERYTVSRELQSRIKECFEKNGIQTAGPGRLYVVDRGKAS